LGQSSASDLIFLNVENTSAAPDTFGSPVDSIDAFVGQTTYLHVMAKVSGCTGMACTDAQIYFNGSPVTTTPLADNTGTLRDDSTFTLRGGLLGNDTNDFDGRMSGVKIYGAAVTDGCAASRFAAGR
jgi:hypothetical protein